MSNHVNDSVCRNCGRVDLEATVFENHPITCADCLDALGKTRCADCGREDLFATHWEEVVFRCRDCARGNERGAARG